MTDARVCAACFGDPDVITWIEGENGEPGCDFCGEKDAPTADIFDLAAHMRECLQTFYGNAGDQLPWDSAEGGFLAPHWDTYDLLQDEIGLDLRRNGCDQLLAQLSDAISSDTWCEFDWLVLSMDDGLAMNWARFCSVVQHQRRFFFHDVGPQDDPDTRVPSELLQTIAELADESGLVRTLPAGTSLWRARTNLSVTQATVQALGPPPAHLALQSNRMNSPGIPMLYAALDSATAIAEMPKEFLTLGRFELRRALRLLDISVLPQPKGIFAGATQRERLGVMFLHEFVGAITKPVARDERVHVDYLPSQVVTEFFRYFPFSEGFIDGICFNSAAHPKGKNLVLFVQGDDISDERDGISKSIRELLALIQVITWTPSD